MDAAAPPFTPSQFGPEPLDDATPKEVEEKDPPIVVVVGAGGGGETDGRWSFLPMGIIAVAFVGVAAFVRGR